MLKITPHIQLPTVLINDFKIHEMMRGQRFKLEVGGFNHMTVVWLRTSAMTASNKLPMPEFFSLMHAITKSSCIVWQRHTMTAQFLRQRFQQQMCFFFQHAGHQPFAAR
jgi:hypothetical protein